jgi:MYXO-CTERM domain-containing protein
MNRKPLAILAVVAITACGALTADAASLYDYGYQLRIDGTGPWGYNAPLISIENTGNTAIASLDITIGGDDYHFDRYTAVTTTGSFGWDVVSIGANDGDLRAKHLLVDFTGFSFGDTWTAAVDIDHDIVKDNGRHGTIEDARVVMFNNGGTSSLVTVTFIDGFILSGHLPNDFLTQMAGLSADGVVTDWGVNGDLYRFGQGIFATSIVPTPTAALAGVALLTAAGVRRRRRR